MQGQPEQLCPGVGVGTHLGQEGTAGKKRQLAFQRGGLWHPTALPSEPAGASGSTAVKSGQFPTLWNCSDD